MADKVTKLTNDDRSILKDISAYSLPANPSGKNLNEAEIKKRLYAPSLKLFDLLKNAIDETNTAFSTQDTWNNTQSALITTNATNIANETERAKQTENDISVLVSSLPNGSKSVVLLPGDFVADSSSGKFKAVIYQNIHQLPASQDYLLNVYSVNDDTSISSVSLKYTIDKKGNISIFSETQSRYKVVIAANLSKKIEKTILFSGVLPTSIDYTLYGAIILTSATAITGTLPNPSDSSQFYDFYVANSSNSTATIVVNGQSVSKGTGVHFRWVGQWTVSSYFVTTDSVTDSMHNQPLNATLKSLDDTNESLAALRSVIPSLNLLNPANLSIGGYIYAGNGNVVTGTSEHWDAMIDYVWLEPNTTYYLGNVRTGDLNAFYDKNKAFVASPDVVKTPKSNANFGTITTGAIGYYFRSSVVRGSESTSYISKYVDSYYQYGLMDYSYSSAIINEKIKDLTSTQISFNSLERSITANLFDGVLSEITSGCGTYIQSTSPGGILDSKSTTNSNRAMQNYVYLEANSTYYLRGFYGSSLYAFYNDDSTKSWAGGPSSVPTGVTISSYSSYPFNNSNCLIKIVIGSTPYWFRGTTNKDYVYGESNNNYSEFGSSVGTPESFSGDHYGVRYICKGDNVVKEYLAKDYSLLMADSAGVNLRSKKVLVIGDSISTDYYGLYPKWVTALRWNGFLPFWSKEPASVLNGYTTNDSIHATGFVATYAGGANAFQNRITTYSDDSYDYIIVFGGINDYIQNVAQTTFETAVNTFFAYLAKHFPSARIIVMTPLHTASLNTANNVGLLQSYYGNYIKTAAQKYSFPVLDLMNEAGYCPEVDEFKNLWTLLPSGYTEHDGVHPTRDYSFKYLAPMIENFIKKFI